MNAVQLPLGIQLAEQTTLEQFVAGPNQATVAALRDPTADMVVLGPVGCGKSHLLQAAARNHDYSAYLPLRKLIERGPGMLEALESLSLVCIDDADEAAGETDWERALLRLVDGLRSHGGHWIAASRTPPHFLTPDLRSRWAWGAQHALAPLADADRKQLLIDRCGGRGMTLPGKVADYLLARIPRDNSSLMAWVQRLDDASLAAGRRLTVPFVRNLLATTLDGAQAVGEHASQE